MKGLRALSAVLSAAVILSSMPAYGAGTARTDEFVLFDGSVSAVYIDDGGEGKTDYSQVIRAAGDLENDIASVTGAEPVLVSQQESLTEQSVIIGTLGKSDLIDELADSQKLDVSGIEGEWEAFTIQLVDSPCAGVEKGLVIAGSDMRGTIYGIYQLSEAIGVSPWYWWGDVPVEKKERVALAKSEIETTEKPDVKYRGIFINDEENFTVWSQKFENSTDSPGTPNANTYAKVFELMLRLKANVLWPAMHQQSTAFNAYINPETGRSYNAEKADEYGVIMGASHCEMLLRNNETEWEPWCEENAAKYNIEKVNGNWKDGYDYTVNPEAMDAYWEERVAENYMFDNVYTIGLRAVHDAAINCKNLENPTPERKAGVVRAAVESQVEILRKYEQKYYEQTGVKKIFPKLFCPYKEASEYFKYDLSLPEETMIVWADDNHGYVRAVSTQEQLDRYGGAGVYYHVSFYDADRPQSYLWVTSTPLTMIYDEMSKAYNAGSDDFWILNVGDIKPSEIPMEFFLEMGWDVDKYNTENITDFTDKVISRDFGLSEEECSRVSDIIAEYYLLNISKRPEYQGANMGDEYSLYNYGDEAQRQINKMEALSAESEAVYEALPENKKDAYYERVHYMIRAGLFSLKKNVYQQKNKLYEKQGRFASVNAYAKESQEAYNQILADLNYFNKQLAGGKWDGIINPYCTIQNLPTIPGAPDLTWLPESEAGEGIGSVCEGQETGNENVTLRFNSLSGDKRFIDIFTKGTNACDYEITVPEAVVIEGMTGETSQGKTVYKGSVEVEQRLWLSVDWDKADESFTDTVTVKSKNYSESYNISAVKSAADPQADVQSGKTGYYESNGEVSIEAEHFSKNVAVGGQEWRVVKGRGRSGDAVKVYPDLSAETNETRIDSNFETASPYLEYDIYFETTGTYKGIFYRLPVLNEGDGKTCRTGISWNGGAVQLLRGNSLVAGGAAWSSGVRNQTEKMDIPIDMQVPSPGWYTLRIYKSDAGMEFDKIDLYNTSVGKKSSNLGAPESFNTVSDYQAPAVSYPPEFKAEDIIYPASDVKYFYDFSSNASRANTGYTGVDNKTVKSEAKGYEWDAETFENVKAYTRTGASKASVRNQGFVYSGSPAAITITVDKAGEYIVGAAVGDRQRNGVAAKEMNVKANGRNVLRNINVPAGQTEEKCFVVRVGEDKKLRLEFSGNWVINSLEISEYNPVESENKSGAFTADKDGQIVIEAEAAAEQSEYAWSTGSADNSGANWSETQGQSGKAMFFGPNKDASYAQTDYASNPGPKMHYIAEFPERGGYFVWAYMKSQSDNDDSVHFSLDRGTPLTINDLNNTEGGFKWFNVGMINAEQSGEHELSVWGREDGLTIDKIILTPSASQPYGLGADMQRKSSAPNLYELSLVLEEAESYSAADYTADSYSAFKTALENAQKAAEDPNAVQTDIDNALKALEDAIYGLQTEKSQPDPDPDQKPEPQPDPDPTPQPKPQPQPAPAVPKNGVKNGILYKNSKKVTGTKVIRAGKKTYYVKRGKVQKGRKIVKYKNKLYAVNNGIVMTAKKTRVVKVGKKSYIVSRKGIVSHPKKGYKQYKVGKKKYIVNKSGVIQKNKKRIRIGKRIYRTNKKGIVVKTTKR